jgi:hypothetical protein
MMDKEWAYCSRNALLPPDLYALEEKPVPVPESVRQEDGREVKVYPKRYADGYQAQKNVKPKRLI